MLFIIYKNDIPDIITAYDLYVFTIAIIIRERVDDLLRRLYALIIYRKESINLFHFINILNANPS